MITILMTTYNGEAYIAQQIESLLAQTEQNFVLRVHDDGSKDQTLAILNDYAARYPEKIFVSQNQKNSGGAKWNFLGMLAAYPDDYVMLCDQDDVWLPNKIAVTLRAMQETEAAVGANTPILVHTDLTVVDGNLQPMHPSFQKMSNLDYRRVALKDQLVQNTMTGCTAMLNRSLQRYLEQLPDYCVMHDWWMMLIASAFGKIVPLENEQTILYRQHARNVVGAKNAGSVSYLYDRIAHSDNTRSIVSQTYQQAESFYRMFSAQLSAEQKALVTGYMEIPKHNKIRRIYDLFALKTWKHGIVRRLGQLFYI